MEFKVFRKIAKSALIVWILLLTIGTVIFPYIRIMHDNSTIVEIRIGEGLLSVNHDVVYDDEVESFANSSILDISGYGPPKLPEFFSDWVVFLGVDCAVLWSSQRTRQWVDGVALWLVALTGVLTFSTCRCLITRLKPRLNYAEQDGAG